MHEDLIGALNRELTRNERAAFNDLTRPRSKPVVEESLEDYRRRMSVKNTTRPLEQPEYIDLPRRRLMQPGYRPGNQKKS